MLRDLLPQSKPEQVNVTVESAVPFFGNDLSSSKTTFTYYRLDDVVYYVGEGWRPHAVYRCKGTPVMMVSGARTKAKPYGPITTPAAR